MPERVTQFAVSKATALEAPLEDFDDLPELSEPGEESDEESLEHVDQDEEDDPDIDIEDADLGEQDDIETGELGNNQMKNYLTKVNERQPERQIYGFA